MIDRCPFCGSAQPDPPIIETEYGATVSCVGCSAQGPIITRSERYATPEQTAQKAIELWNRRSLGRAEIQQGDTDG